MTPVQIVEVGPRDGFQLIKAQIPTAAKIDLIMAMKNAGISRMEVGSFVRPDVLPQMADIREILAAVPVGDDFVASVLVPNLKGAELALASGVSSLVVVVSASDSHSRANVRRSREDAMAEVAEICRQLPDGVSMRFDIATAFHCPFEGRVAEADVLDVAESLLKWCPSAEICLCDTIGKAIPEEVSGLFSKSIKIFGGDLAWAFHAHDTYGFGIANVLAAFHTGVRIFDGAVAGLGGCPFAPGATGNVATEDLVYTFGRMNLVTGIDLDRFLEAADTAALIDGGAAGGHIRKAQRSVKASCIIYDDWRSGGAKATPTGAAEPGHF